LTAPVQAKAGFRSGAQGARRAVEAVEIVPDVVAVAVGHARAVAIGIELECERCPRARHRIRGGNDLAEAVVAGRNAHARGAVEARIGHAAEGVVAVVDITGVGGIKPGAFGCDFFATGKMRDWMTFVIIRNIE
jgi:hypothetical protein